ncbi:hypothetical protein CEXT_711201 [Caerostris extrusa]|uniref:Uncharacterized protein n=1 Tax=Caerostris extrusa TaxID=172846 RepID=A0AAV4PTH7_CAEEX|nr:hypothetical protein CEXT_711201 [Caerostris extrusa]
MGIKSQGMGRGYSRAREGEGKEKETNKSVRGNEDGKSDALAMTDLEKTYEQNRESVYFPSPLCHQSGSRFASG